MTIDVIEDMLGLGWWEEVPDDNTLMALIDRIMDAEGLDCSTAESEIVQLVERAAKQLGSNERFDIEAGWQKAIRNLYRNGKLKWDIG